MKLHQNRGLFWEAGLPRAALVMIWATWFLSPRKRRPPCLPLCSCLAQTEGMQSVPPLSLPRQRSQGNGDNKTPRLSASQKGRLVYPNADTGSSAKAGNAWRRAIYPQLLTGQCRGLIRLEAALYFIALYFCLIYESLDKFNLLSNIIRTTPGTLRATAAAWCRRAPALAASALCW